MPSYRPWFPTADRAVSYSPRIVALGTGIAAIWTATGRVAATVILAGVVIVDAFTTWWDRNKERRFRHDEREP